jgi:fused signal recognition particle receptor
MSRFSRLLDGLARTRRAIADGLRAALAGGRVLDAEALGRLEETLIAADIGVDTTTHLLSALRSRLGSCEATEETAAAVLADEIERVLAAASRRPGAPDGVRPFVTMVVGVNGVGKTTTIGKLAARHAAEGRTVIVAAADTFRAAAGEQLAVWAGRSDAQIVGGESGGDPAAVAFDALAAAVARGADVLIVDTAGRLHTRSNLMAELQKIRRVLGGRMPGAPHETLLVLDANTGQNALEQARQFDQALGLSGVFLAKLDGTARGGIVVAIARELRLPVLFVGTGEGVADVEEFDPRAFARALVGLPEGEAPARPAA